MTGTINWLSAAAILGSGLIVGALFVFFFSRRKPARIESNLEQKDLEAKRDALVQQLRGAEVSADERDRLERETANVLRQLDSRPMAQNKAAATVESSPMNPTIKGFIWGAGSMAALAALGYFVMQTATPRQEGDSPTGGGPMLTAEQQQMQQQSQMPQQPQANALVARLEQAVQRDPNNLQLRNDLAQAYLETDNLMAVFEQTKFVLSKSPNDSRALTFQALVRMAMGEGDTAVSMLQQATRSDPKNLDSWVALAWIHSQRGQMKETEAAIAEAARVSPENKEKLEAVLRQMKAGGSGAAGQQAELPADHPPVTPPPGAPSGPSVRVTVEVETSARGKSGTLFVIARNLGGGPPVAVKRIPSPSFPLTLDLSAADSMMGQPLPEKFRVEARLDADGDPMTRPATDPLAQPMEVALGANVKLALK